MPFIIIFGIIAFLLMEHAVVFWLVFVPLALILVLTVVKWFKAGGLGLSELVTAAIVGIMMLIALMIVCIP